MPSAEAFRSMVIVNPTSAAGATGRRWEHVARCLQAALGPFEHAFTRSSGDAAALTRRALREGFEMIVAVGGDGTLNEVVCGFFDGRESVAPEGVLGVVPLGTGSDFGRTLGLTGVEAACDRLRGRSTRRVDVGHASYTDHTGALAQRVFINVASFGCSGLVARLVSPGLKAASGKLAFTLATLRALVAYRDQVVTLEFDDAPARSLPVTNCAFGNGRYFGAGMQVTPAALLDDGQFDVTIWSGFGLLDFVRRQRALYDGSHVRERGAEVLRVRRASATSAATVLLELDGESVGRLPVRLEVLPLAVRLKS
jgi:YegS/Rv2252/BmrU family lipid kinase